MRHPRVSVLLLPVLLVACRDERAAPPSASAAAASPLSAAPSAAAPAPAKQRAPVREGSAIARAVSGDMLFIADEDAKSLVQVPMDLDPSKTPTALGLESPPAQVLPLDGRVLVTSRSAPGRLHVVATSGHAPPAIKHSIELPADAWGVAVTPDERIALVTSAWTHKVSAVDLENYKMLWSVDVGREPRGVVITGDGKTAYITHLVRASVTRIDDIAGEPKVRVVALPAAPDRTTPDRAEAATLGYAPVLSPDGSRLYVARQALGAMGLRSWAGQAAVDILVTADETSLSTRPKRWYAMQAPDYLRTSDNGFGIPHTYGLTGPVLPQGVQWFSQPRAAVYRRATDTLLVASEGTDDLIEFDALSVDPSIDPLRRYDLGEALKERAKDRRDVVGRTKCGAPSGVALSSDERSAFVLCRSSRNIVEIKLDAFDPERPYESSSGRYFPLSPDPLPEQAALGRRLFYNASDWEMSEGFACASCHPDGRDDGHIWREESSPFQRDVRNMHAFEVQEDSEGLRKGVPRQTPMLAGRVDAPGPYGWKAESNTLRHRVLVGFTLHRWAGMAGGATLSLRAEAIAEFLRKGLVAPPREEREPSTEEQRGKQLFLAPEVGCATCHVAGTGYTNRALVGLGAWAVDKKRLDPEEGDDWRFKTPSLLFVGGTPPYYHDGSEATLEGLIDHNGTRMGHTKQLSAADRAALVAFLRTL